MKKLLKIIIIVILLIIIYNLIFNVIIDRHDSDYKIKVSKNTYSIVENYDKNNYLFTIKDNKKKSFVYSYTKDLNNKKKIIDDIVVYKNKDLYCIGPVIDNKIDGIVCRLNNKLISYDYLVQKKDDRLNNLYTKIKKSKYDYNEKLFGNNLKSKEKYNTTIYSDIDENIYVTLWNYSRLFVINNSNINKKELLKKDAYENNASILVDKYYITTNTDKSYYNEYYLINTLNLKTKKIEINDEISRKSIFNGVYKNELYITDPENEKQYIINPKKKSIKETTPKYYDGKQLIDVDVDNASKKFKYINITSKLKKKYNDSLTFSNGCYYYIDDSNVYQVINNKKVLLFNLDKFREMKVVNGNLFGISNDTLYLYNKSGLKKVLSNRELIYNSSNIYDVYIKEN